MSDPQPVCTMCGSTMKLVVIEPGNPGFDVRIFKCPNCHSMQQYIIESGGTLRCEPDFASPPLN
jgi:hypothetical protein